VWHGVAGQLSWERAAAEHDLGVFSVPVGLSREDFVAGMRQSFFAHPFIVEFAAQIDPDGIRFGAVKQWIKRACLDIPVPHARELTFPTQALIRWFPYLAPDDYEIVIPGRRSEVLRRRQ
jgi:hypothetical protein